MVNEHDRCSRSLALKLRPRQPPSYWAAAAARVAARVLVRIRASAAAPGHSANRRPSYSELLGVFTSAAARGTIGDLETRVLPGQHAAGPVLLRPFRNGLRVGLAQVGAATVAAAATTLSLPNGHGLQ